MMVDKVRDVIKELINLGDTVKADEIQSRLKRIQEDALRQLKDKNELFESENIILALLDKNYFFNCKKKPFTK